MSARWPVLLPLAAAAVVLDQWTKSWADAQLRFRGVVTILEGVFDLRYSRNTGAFFSFGADWEPGFRRAFFIAGSLVAMALIASVARSLKPTQARLRWAMTLLLAGAAGNMIDRVRRGEVTDFLHLHIGELFHWATFNAADVYIAAGLVLLVLDVLRPQGTARAPVQGPAEAP